MSEPFRILLIGDEPDVLEPLRRHVLARGYAVLEARGSDEALAQHREHVPDLLLLVLPMQVRSSRLLGSVRAQDGRTPVIVTGRDADVGGAGDAFDLGATDYVPDPVGDVQRLLSAMGVALGARKHDVQLRLLRQRDAANVGWQMVAGQCESMRQVMSVVHQICRRSASWHSPTILITGETGTGKGMLAKHIHYQGVRRNQTFVDLNCAALPPSLVEAELFGHERGVFTDARTARAGLVETADGGTLFLDEIGTLPLELQSKLLSVIETKQVRRIGARQPVQVDAQIIAATNRDLAQMVQRQEFRADLYHRLNVLAVTLPPLRERGEDSVLLAESFVAALCRDHGLPPRTLTPAAREAILAYDWPGNVRELKNVLERVIFLGDSETIDAPQLGLSGVRAPNGWSNGGAEVSVEMGSAGLHVRLPEQPFSLEALEREIIRLSLQRFRGNVTRAARYLSISRQTMIYRIKKHELLELASAARSTRGAHGGQLGHGAGLDEADPVDPGEA